MMTSPDLDDTDRAVFERLSLLAYAEASTSTPSPAVDRAVRHSIRRRRVRTGVTLVACLGAVALVLPQLSVPGVPTTPAGPHMTVPAPGGDVGDIDMGTLGSTFGNITLTVDFDVQVASSQPLPDGRECVVFDHPEVLAARDGPPVPSLARFAADGCRGGVVNQDRNSIVDPGLPFAAAVVDLGACSLESSEEITTAGGLAAVRSVFDCTGGSLQQWIFDQQVIWSIDGGPRMRRFVESAAVAANR